MPALLVSARWLTFVWQSVSRGAGERTCIRSIVVRVSSALELNSPHCSLPQQSTTGRGHQGHGARSPRSARCRAGALRGPRGTSEHHRRGRRKADWRSPWRGGGFCKHEPVLPPLTLLGAPCSRASGDEKRDERDPKVSVTLKLVYFLKGR